MRHLFLTLFLCNVNFLSAQTMLRTLFLKIFNGKSILLILVISLWQFSFAFSDKIDLRFVNSSGEETNLIYRNFFCKYFILANKNINFDSLIFLQQEECLIDYSCTDKSILVFTKKNKCTLKFKYKGEYAEKELLVRDVDFNIISKISPSSKDQIFEFNVIPPRSRYLYHKTLKEVKINYSDTIFIELLTENSFKETVYKPEKTLTLLLTVFKNGMLYQEIVHASFTSGNKFIFPILPLFYHGTVTYNAGLAYFVGSKLIEIFEFYCVFEVNYGN